MTMSSPLVGQAGSAQPQMLRIQIGGAGSAQKAVGVPSVAATAAATTTAAQHVVLQSSSSPQKVSLVGLIVDFDDNSGDNFDFDDDSRH